MEERNEAREELKEELKLEIRDELIYEIKKELRIQIEEEFRTEIMEEIRNKIEEELAQQKTVTVLDSNSNSKEIILTETAWQILQQMPILSKNLSLKK